MSKAEDNGSNGPAFEWWMISNVANGAGYYAFVILLIPAYVTQVTGNAADAGVVMAIIGLAAVVGPMLGKFADRYMAHRLVLNLGMLAMALAFVAFALSSETTSLFAIDALLMGVAVAAINAIGPAFIVGANLPPALEARQLAVYDLISPIGQLLGGALLAAVAAAGWSLTQRFWLAAAIMFVAFLITWLTSRSPAERLTQAMQSPTASDGTNHSQAEGVQPRGLKQVLVSTFGPYILILVLSSVAYNGIINQISNILPNVFGISEAATASLISLAGLLNIAVFLFGGWWMGRSGLMPTLLTGHAMRLIGALGLAVLGLVANAPVLLVVAFVQILYQALPFVRLSQPVGAMRFSTVAAGEASGWVIGASAVGSFMGGMLGGFLADTLGFNSINWMAAIAAGLAVGLIILLLFPANRRIETSEPVS
jgi:predicted MFS family arabinose efflux permease